jgi:YspA, cpYpsA-related SLOG family
MKTIIAGSRKIVDTTLLTEAIIASGFTITEVVSGMAHGVDRMGQAWATEHGMPIKHFPADWKLYGRGAGPVRNRAMADYADALIALWDGKSKGTQHMIKTARERSLMIYIHGVE